MSSDESFEKGDITSQILSESKTAAAVHVISLQLGLLISPNPYSILGKSHKNHNNSSSVGLYIVM